MYDEREIDTEEQHTETRRRARQWLSATERRAGQELASPTPAHAAVTFLGGSTARQMERIADAWAAACSPFGDGARDRAVSELLTRAAEAGLSAAELARFVDRSVAETTAARDAVRTALRARLAAAGGRKVA